MVSYAADSNSKTRCFRIPRAEMNNVQCTKYNKFHFVLRITRLFDPVHIAASVERLLRLGSNDAALLLFSSLLSSSLLPGIHHLRSRAIVVISCHGSPSVGRGPRGIAS